MAKLVQNKLFTDEEKPKIIKVDRKKKQPESTPKDWHNPLWHNHIITRVLLESDQGDFKWDLQVCSRFISVWIFEKWGEGWVTCGQLNWNGDAEYTLKHFQAFAKGMGKLEEIAEKMIDGYRAYRKRLALGLVKP